MLTNHDTYAAAVLHGVVISEHYGRESRVFKVTGFPPALIIPGHALGYSGTKDIGDLNCVSIAY
jgi:hypothetical protein